MEKERYYIVDYLRAFVIINMILYHTMWDVVYILNKNIEWYTSDIGEIWQRFICITFIMLSGFCWSLSKNHLKRGLIVFGAGLLISGVTIVFMPENAVKFGILTFIGSCVLIMIILEKGLRFVNPYVGMVTAIVLFCTCAGIEEGSIFFNNVNLPDVLYQGNFMTYLGFMDNSFFSTDYFPILPWIFLFVAGYFGYRVFKSCNLLDFLKSGKNSAIRFVSGHSLVIYLLHQPIVYGTIFLLEWVI